MSARPRVFVTHNLIPAPGIQLLTEANCEVIQWDKDEPISREEFLSHVYPMAGGMDAIFCTSHVIIDTKLLDTAGPSLKVIGTMSVGHDNIDVKECQRRNILIGYTPDILTDAVAELAVSLLLTVSRRIVEGFDVVKSGAWTSAWRPLWMCGQGLMGSTVGIVGLGRIGTAVATRLKAFSPKSLLYCGNSPKPAADALGAEFVSFNDLLGRSDFVVVTCPFTPQTRGLFDRHAFSQMKSGAVFVNVGRGGVVNQDDLYTALSTGGIRAAGLDVTTPEPLPTDHPLLTLKNCVVLPHIGSATEDTHNAMAEVTARNILAGLKGQPLVYELKI